MRRPAIVCLAALALVACLAGCLADDPAGESGAAQEGNPLTTFDAAQVRPEATFGPGVELEVVYSGMWSGAFGSPEAIHSDEGFGNRTLELPQNANRIQARFQKQETTDEPLVLRLVQNGTVLQEASGGGPLAVVTLEVTPAP